MENQRTTIKPGIHILVVDGNEQIRLLIEDYLLSRGNNVSVASNSQHAIQSMALTKFDLAFVDYDMPGMKGLEMACVLKKMNPRMTIILMSGSFDMETVNNALCEGFEIIQKPFTLPDIQEIVIREENVRTLYGNRC